MSTPTADRSLDAQAFIARRLAEDPSVSANALYREAQAAGMATRRTTFLRDVREMAEYLEIGGRSTQAHPERSIPRRATRQQDVASIVSLARRKYGGKIGPARREHNQRNPDRAVSMKTVQREAGAAIAKRGGQWQANAFDRLPRRVDATTTDGVVSLTVRDSRTASLISQHANAVNTYLRTGDASGLQPFRGKHFTVDSQRYTLETDPNRLEELEDAGDLDDLEFGT